MNVLLCPLSSPGFLYPAIAVGLRLRAAGHSVFVLTDESGVDTVGSAGLVPVAAIDCGERHAFDVRRWFQQAVGQYRAIRQAARLVSADVLVTSLLCHGALLAGEAADLPVVVLGLATHLWTYARGGDEPAASAAARKWREREFLRLYRAARDQVGLPARATGQRALFGSVLLLRGAPALECPGARLPVGVRHVGLCEWEPQPDPAELADIDERLRRVGKPVIYVHLGRTFGATNLWPRINAMFTGGPFQAIVELGRTGPAEAAPAADLVVVRKRWMGPLVERSAVVLTNATSAPVLSALHRRRSLVVAPDGSEQPVLAAACVRAGVALPCPPHTPAVLTHAATDPAIRHRVRELSATLSSPGPQFAADLIGSVITGRRAPGRPDPVASSP